MTTICLPGHSATEQSLQALRPVVQRYRLKICWRRRMSRDQRVRDNWALLHAAELAAQNGAPVAVAFNLVRDCTVDFVQRTSMLYCAFEHCTTLHPALGREGASHSRQEALYQVKLAMGGGAAATAYLLTQNLVLVGRR